MKLLIVRHAVALERDEWKKISSDDRERPLTEDGAKKMKRVAKGLKAILGEEPDCIITSPLLRAKQTADILSNEMPSAKMSESESLAPEKEVESFTKFLRTFPPNTNLISCVGHEPHLNHLVAWLISKSRNGIGELKKGGACLIEFPEEIAAGKGELRWLLTSRQLRDYPLT